MRYRLVLPPPWHKIALARDRRAQLTPILDAAVARVPQPLPDGVSRDDVIRARARLEGDLLRELARAADSGGVDYYLPADLMHGVQLNSSFLVSSTVPDALATAELVPRVMAQLFADDGTEPVQIDDTIWVRRTSVLDRPADQRVADEVRVRKVEYRVAVPDDPRRWVITTFTTVGDGDPESEFTQLMVELFDAIMSTWRWDAAAETH